MIPHLTEFDEVLVTGTEIYSGIRVNKLPATVGTVDSDGRIKLWPNDYDNPIAGHASYDGKLWFDRATVEIEVVQ